MGKGLNKRLTQVILPLGLGVVGSLSLIVWSQKPVVQPMAAALPVTATVTDQQTASFDPYHPTAQVQDSTPAVAPVAFSTVNSAPAGALVGGNYAVAATISTGSTDLPVTLTTSTTGSDSSKVSPSFAASAVAADTSATVDSAFITAKTATITVGSADIFVLSSANIHFVN